MDKWIRFFNAEQALVNGGCVVRHGEDQIAVFNFKDKTEWYAVENNCPHQNQMVLSRGIMGDQDGEPKIVCPLHKNAYSLKTGKLLNGEHCRNLKTYAIKNENGGIFIKVKPLTEAVPV